MCPNYLVEAQLHSLRPVTFILRCYRYRVMQGFPSGKPPSLLGHMRFKEVCYDTLSHNRCGVAATFGCPRAIAGSGAWYFTLSRGIVGGTDG